MTDEIDESRLNKKDITSEIVGFCFDDETPAAIVTVFGKQLPSVCCKCGAAVDPIGFVARAPFVGDQVYCKECNAEVGVDRV
ncbi:hypothetical protein [uncultured Methanocorpusculum sp.]|nr:hypothetical protein [uncultured Methanocorpusculum sp.]